jgi:hypothetical protein
MKTYIWHGTGAIHTPSGPVERGQMFTSPDLWLTNHPQRQWLKRGLITLIEAPSEERPAAEERPAVKTSKK